MKELIGKESPYSQTTHHTEVQVFPFYLEEESRPEFNAYVFTYQIKITNYGSTRIQLLNRKWIVRDGKKNEQVVQGEGVIGKRPVLHSAQVFTYTSYCLLKTPTGNMRGTYTFNDLDTGEVFEVTIPGFFLRTKDNWPKRQGLYQDLQDPPTF